MTNSILGSISRFWLEINASAWRYCPETIQHRLTSAHSAFLKDMREELCRQSDSDFGHGWREGHEVGRLTGWAERDRLAQRELAHKNDQIQALMMMVESYRLQASDVGPAESGDELPEPSLASISVGDPRAPVH